MRHVIGRLVSTSDSAALGPTIRRFRLSAGLSQEQLAEQASVSARAISDLERGLRSNPRPDTLRMIADGLGLSENQRSELLTAARPELSTPDPTRTQSRGRRSDLPTIADELFGREGELEGIAAILLQTDTRLVTLVGPGGVGKTRLAIELANSLAPSFRNGAVFIDLSSTSDSRLVGSDIAQALGAAQIPERKIDEVLCEVFRTREQLLVIDNFEQVIEAAPLIGQFIASAPDLKILITSREPLRIRGESEISIEPLSVPDAAQQGSDIAESPAVKLFWRSAMGANPALEDSLERYIAVAEICRRLDGLPLAIELAAARVRHYPPEILLTHLEERLPILVSGPRDLPVRQQTMRDTIAWSYDLLTPGEQRLFRWCGIFAAGWSLGSLQRMVGGNTDASVQVLNDLTSLIDKNLIRESVGHKGVPGFSLFETIREFARVLLEREGETDAARAAHAEIVLKGARDRLGAEYDSLIGLADLDLPRDEIDEIRQAVGWFAAREDAESMATIVAGFQDFFYVQGMFEETAALAHDVLALDRIRPLTPQVHTAALIVSSSCLSVLGKHQTAEKHGRDALASAEAIRDDSGLVFAALVSLAVDIRDQGDLAEARDLAERALRIPETTGERKSIYAQFHLGKIAMMMDDLERAEELLSEAARRSQSLGNVEVGPYAFGLLAHTRTREGKLTEAASAFRVVVEHLINQRPGNTWIYFAYGASLAAATGFKLEAVRLHGFYRTNSEEFGWRLPQGEWFERQMVDVREATESEIYENEYRAGTRMSANTAIELLSSVLDEIDAVPSST